MNEDKSAKLRAGSPVYMAPEALNGKSSKKSDAWSIGVVMFYALMGKLPFTASDPQELYNNVQNGLFDRKLLSEAFISVEAKELISGLIEVDENKRLSVEDSLNSRWLKKFQLLSEKTKKSLTYFEKNNIVENLRKFEKYSNFKKEILFYIAKISNDEEMRQVKEIFIEFDSDHTGTIKKDEISDIFIRLGMTPDEVFLYNQGRIKNDMEEFGLS